MFRRRAGRVDQQRREEAPEPRAEVEVDVHQVGDDRAAEDRMREAVTDVAHPPQHDADVPIKPHSAADQRRDQQAVPEELVLHRLGEPAHDADQMPRTGRAAPPRPPAGCRSSGPATTRISALNVRLRIGAVKTFAGQPWATIAAVDADDPRQVRRQRS